MECVYAQFEFERVKQQQQHTVDIWGSNLVSGFTPGVSHLQHWLCELTDDYFEAVLLEFYVSNTIKF